MGRQTRLAGFALLVAVMLAGCAGAGAPARAPEASEAPAPAPVDPPAIPADDGGESASAVVPVPDCPPAPDADVRVAGQVLGPRQINGFGTYCHRSIDGLATDFLDETRAAPGARVDLQYRSSSTWDTVTYHVWQGDKRIAEGSLPPSGNFTLPQAPGTYTVVLQFGAASGTISHAFRVALASR